jgi:hypothetical protein
MKQLWRTVSLGRWAVMHYTRAIETAWLVCCRDTVILTADPLPALMALAVWHVCRIAPLTPAGGLGY